MMYDNYSHKEDGIVYIVENIPGPEEQSDEYISLIEEFNSQLIHSCDCDEKCEDGFCNCLKNFGGINYTTHLESHDLKVYKTKKQKNIFTYAIIECSEHCKCSEKCGNRLVQNGPIKTLHVATCEEISKGLGLFTNKLISKGSYVCEYAGEVITKSEAARRHRYNQSHNKMNYIFCLKEHVNNNVIQTFVDPSMFGNIGRYINHSCEPKCEIIAVRVNSPIPKLAVFSCVDIFANEEITFDYGANYITNSISQNLDKRKRCFCRSNKCKGYMPYEVY